MENEIRPLLSLIDNVKKMHNQANKENFPLAMNVAKKPLVSQKFIQNIVSNNPNKASNTKFHPIDEKKNNSEDHHKYLKKLVGLDISQTIQAVDEPQENLPIINDISIIKEENPNQITMIEHSEFSQNNTFFQKDDINNESSLINYEENLEM